MLSERAGLTLAMRRLIELFAAHSADRSTLDELHRMSGDRSTWRHAHDLFQRIRLKKLAANRQGDAKLEAQFQFEESCAKTLYNLSNTLRRLTVTRRIGSSLMLWWRRGTSSWIRRK